MVDLKGDASDSFIYQRVSILHGSTKLKSILLHKSRSSLPTNEVGVECKEEQMEAVPVALSFRSDRLRSSDQIEFHLNSNKFQVD